MSHPSSESLGAALAALLEVPGALAELRNEVRDLRASLEAVREALPPMLVSPAEAARRLGVSVATVRRRLRSGELRSVRLGRRFSVDLGTLTPVGVDKVAELAAVARLDDRREQRSRHAGGR